MNCQKEPSAWARPPGPCWHKHLCSGCKLCSTCSTRLGTGSGAPTASVSALLQGSSSPRREGCRQPRLSPRTPGVPVQPPTCCSGLETAEVTAAWFRVHPSQHHAWQLVLLSHCIAPHPAATSSRPSAPQRRFSCGSHKEAAAPASSMGIRDREQQCRRARTRCHPGAQSRLSSHRSHCPGQPLCAASGGTGTPVLKQLRQRSTGLPGWREAD